MKELELRLYLTCSLCHQPIGKAALPVFSRVTFERIGIKMDSVRRQDGLTAMLGGHARLAQAMGTDEDMTVSLSGVTTLSICEKCYVDPKPLAIAHLAELPSVLPVCSCPEDNVRGSSCAEAMLPPAHKSPGIDPDCQVHGKNAR